MSEKASVQVLMSCFNGERYLTEQLESVLAQQGVDVSILVRDDGSSDSTVDILENYRQRGLLQYLAQSNVGVPRSFFTLLKSSREDVSYYAFSDQDDVWLPGKLAAAVEMLGEGSAPRIYAGRAVRTDEKLCPFPNDQKWVYRPMKPSFGNALAQNVLHGCTIVMNKAMRDELIAYDPHYALSHDWPSYMVASAVGEIIVDEKPYVLYRQHGHNELGQPTVLGRIAKYKRLYRQFSRQHAYLKQVQEYARRYEKILPEENRRLLHLVLSYRDGFLARFPVVFSKEIRRQGMLDNLVYKLAILLDML